MPGLIRGRSIKGDHAINSPDVKDRIRVARHDGIVRHQSQRLSKGLGDENAVERVLMMSRQRFDLCSVSRGDREQQVSRSVKEIKRFTCSDGHVAATQRVLNGDFPNARSAYPDIVFRRRDLRPRVLRQPRTINDRPQRNVRIQEKIQGVTPPSNKRATASLFASMVAGTSKEPFAMPKR